MRKKVVTVLTLAVVCIQASAQVSLDSCRHMAMRNNKEIGAAALKIEGAGYDRKTAHAAYLPSFDLNASYFYNQKKLSLVEEDQLLPTKTFNPETGQYDFNLLTNPSTGVPVQVNGQYVPSTVALLPKSALTYNIHNVFAGALSVTQPIYMGGKIRAMNAITKYAEELAQSMHDSKVEDVLYDVDAAYWQVVSVKAKQKLAESYVDLVKSLDEDVRKMVKEGVATHSNQLTVDVRLNEANVDLVKVNNGLALSRMLLNQLCGQPIGDVMVLADEDRENWVNGQARESNPDMNEVFDRRNDIRSLQLATKIYDEKALVARSEMLPKLAAVASYTLMNPNSYNGYETKFAGAFVVGATLSVPLWHWGGLSNKYKSAQVDAKIKKMELADVKEKVTLQVNQANFRYQEAFKTLEMTQANLAKANENLRTAQVGFKEGVATTDDVLAAQTAWLKANSEKIDAEIDVQLCDVYLSKVLGRMQW